MERRMLVEATEPANGFVDSKAPSQGAPGLSVKSVPLESQVVLGSDTSDRGTTASLDWYLVTVVVKGDDDAPRSTARVLMGSDVKHAIDRPEPRSSKHKYWHVCMIHGWTGEIKVINENKTKTQHMQGAEVPDGALTFPEGTFDINCHVVDQDGAPLKQAKVAVKYAGCTLASGKTDADGAVQLGAGWYHGKEDEFTLQATLKNYVGGALTTTIQGSPYQAMLVLISKAKEEGDKFRFVLSWGVERDIDINVLCPDHGVLINKAHLEEPAQGVWYTKDTTTGFGPDTVTIAPAPNSDWYVVVPMCFMFMPRDSCHRVTWCAQVPCSSCCA